MTCCTYTTHAEKYLAYVCNHKLCYCTERKSLRNSENEQKESRKLYHTQMKTDCDVYVNNTLGEICKKIKKYWQAPFVSTKSSISREHTTRTNSEVVIGPSV